MSPGLRTPCVFAATRLTTPEAVALVATQGVGPRRMAGIVLKESSRNFSRQHALVARILSGQLDGRFSLKLSRKDVPLSTPLGLASEVRCCSGQRKGAAAFYRRAMLSATMRAIQGPVIITKTKRATCIAMTKAMSAPPAMPMIATESIPPGLVAR